MSSVPKRGRGGEGAAAVGPRADEVIDLTSDDLAQDMVDQPPSKRRCDHDLGQGGGGGGGGAAVVDDKTDGQFQSDLSLALRLSMDQPGAYTHRLPGSNAWGDASGGLSVGASIHASLTSLVAAPAAVPTSFPSASLTAGPAAAPTSGPSSVRASTRSNLPDAFDSIPSANQVVVAAGAGAAAATSVPSSWSGAGASRVPLEKASREFKSVFQAFHHKSPEDKYEILTIERIEKKRVFQSFMLLQEEMEEINGPGGAHEMKLFHGTKWDVAEKMVSASCASVFNRSYAGKHGVSYGQGCYFVRQSSYADKYAHPSEDGVCCMFSARVLTGKSRQGNAAMVEPPAGYQSTCNAPSRDISSIFVTYQDAQSTCNAPSRDISSIFVTYQDAQVCLLHF
ncbi:hypothetical protein T484DRAFT_1915527 [Baffinella frigidus]|nr:hypothetical protein T484DRAFT_1915527 [Cryptophyta sp. CCMP2293]